MLSDSAKVAKVIVQNCTKYLGEAYRITWWSKEMLEKTYLLMAETCS